MFPVHYDIKTFKNSNAFIHFDPKTHFCWRELFPGWKPPAQSCSCYTPVRRGLRTHWKGFALESAAGGPGRGKTSRPFPKNKEFAFYGKKTAKTLCFYMFPVHFDIKT